MYHPPPGFADEEGSFALMLALSLSIILLIFSLVLDLGWFTRVKNQYQNAAEAAALAVAAQYCQCSGVEGMEALALTTIMGFNLDIPTEGIAVESGFYDAFDQYDIALGEFQDFAGALTTPLPPGESINAVRVTIGEGRSMGSLTGLNGAREILGSAVAYLPQTGMVAQGNIDFLDGRKITLENGRVYAMGDIELRGDKLAFSKRNMTMAAKGRINTYQHIPGPFPGDPGFFRQDGHRASDPMPERPLLKSISIDDLMARFMLRVDKTCTPHHILKECYGFFPTSDESGSAFFDFTKERPEHEVVFINLPEGYRVYLTPYPCNVPGAPGNLGALCTICDSGNPSAGKCVNRDPFGDRVTNLTILATCDVVLPIHKDRDPTLPITYGGPGNDQLTIITTGSIQFSSRSNPLSGVNLMAQGDVKMIFEHVGGDYIPPDPNYVRIISEDKITFNKCGESFATPHTFSFSFGFQCPALLPPQLGLLEVP